VGDLSGLSELSGKDLVTQAFRPADENKPAGPLVDPEMDRREGLALMALFQGAVRFFRNPVSHREVEYGDPTEASEVVPFADLLLRILDKIERRINSQEEA
jgi:uncharacterized protein (TIGR02391 family)